MPNLTNISMYSLFRIYYECCFFTIICAIPPLRVNNEYTYDIINYGVSLRTSLHYNSIPTQVKWPFRSVIQCIWQRQLLVLMLDCSTSALRKMGPEYHTITWQVYPMNCFLSQVSQTWYTLAAPETSETKALCQIMYVIFLGKCFQNIIFFSCLALSEKFEMKSFGWSPRGFGPFFMAKCPMKNHMLWMWNNYPWKWALNYEQPRILLFP